MKKRRKFTAEFKSKVALEALREQQPIHEIGKRYQIHPSQVTEWKKSLLEQARSVFESERSKHDDGFKQKLKDGPLMIWSNTLKTKIVNGGTRRTGRSANSKWRWIF